MAFRNFIERHAVPTYFVLAYLVTWVGIVAIVGPRGIWQGSISTPQFLLIWVAMLAGSGGVGLIMAAALEGRAGLRVLLVGMRRWRFPAREYAPLLVVLLVVSVVQAVLVQLSPNYTPQLLAASNKMVPLVMFLVVAFGAFVEELGWTGFATRRLLGRASVVRTGLLVGLLWGSWHFLADFTGSRAIYGGLFGWHFLAFWLIPLTAFRVLIVLVYDRTRSLLLAQLMHASYSPVLFVLGPAAASATESVTYEIAFTLLLCVVVASILTLERRRQPALPHARALS
jgi:uncharacterized protein